MAVVNALPEMLARLAAVRLQSGSAEPAVRMLARWTEPQRPAHLPESVWADFLRELLRRSGLLTEHPDDFVFLHETLTEYLAARHVASAEAASAQAFRVLFDQAWTRHRRRVAEVWRFPRDWSSSYCGFLVAAWLETPALASRLGTELQRLAAHGGLPGCWFIADRAAEGFAIDPAALALATDVFATLAASATEYRFGDATRALAQIGTPQAMEHLAAIASNAWYLYPGPAIEAIAQIGTPQATQHLATLAGRRINQCVAAAETLIGLGDERGRAYLATIAADSACEDTWRVRAARKLAELDDEHGMPLLFAIATGGSVAPDERVEAALALLELGDARSADLLATLAADHAVRHRTSPAETLAEAGDPRGRELLAAIAADGALADVESRYAAQKLARLGDARGREMMVVIATDESLGPSPQREARQVLEALGDARAEELLHRPVEGTRLLYAAVNALLELGEHRVVTSVLLRLATDSAAHAYRRRQAAEALAQLGDERGKDALAATAADSTFHAIGRRQAAEALAQLGDQRGKDALTVLATDATAWAFTRLDAAKALATLGDERGRDTLAAAAADTTLRAPERLEAARALAELGDERARNALTAIAAHRLRRYARAAARDLAKYGWR